MSNNNATNQNEEIINTGSTGTLINFAELTTFNGEASWGSSYGSDVKVVQNTGIQPVLYFKYIKKKFSPLENMRINNRIKRLEKAFNKSVANGQSALAKKFLNQIVIYVRESELYAKGIKFFIESGDLNKYKNKIRNGHISDTKLDKFTRIIPKDILKKKKKFDGMFDDYVIYHYWNEEASEKSAKGQKMSSEEKSAMRDPVLFGIIRETDRLYFIAEWEDELCDLTFDEIVDAVGKDEKEITIKKKPFEELKEKNNK